MKVPLSIHITARLMFSVEIPVTAAWRSGSFAEQRALHHLTYGPGQ